jgi:hypothetical protein
MENEVKKVFRSRISILLTGFILVMFILISIPMLQHKIYRGMYILGGISGFIVFLLSGMRYVIAGEKLYINIWFIPCENEKISNIISVEQSYIPIASCAASLRKLRINLKKGVYSPFTLVSPVRKQEFIEELKAINPRYLY